MSTYLAGWGLGAGWHSGRYHPAAADRLHRAGAAAALASGGIPWAGW
jgi:hypothetical protein